MFLSFIHWKNVIAASESNNIVPLCRYSFGVDFPILIMTVIN